MPACREGRAGRDNRQMRQTKSQPPEHGVIKTTTWKAEHAKKHLSEAVVTYQHFQEAVKKVRSSRESNPMERVAAPFYK